MSENSFEQCNHDYEKYYDEQGSEKCSSCDLVTRSNWSLAMDRNDYDNMTGEEKRLFCEVDWS